MGFSIPDQGFNPVSQLEMGFVIPDRYFRAGQKLNRSLAAELISAPRPCGIRGGSTSHRGRSPAAPQGLFMMVSRQKFLFSF